MTISELIECGRWEELIRDISGKKISHELDEDFPDKKKQFLNNEKHTKTWILVARSVD
jgi:hypothetical protein